MLIILGANVKTKQLLTGWCMWLIAALFYALDYFQHTAPSVLIEPIANTLNTSFVTIANIMGIYFPLYALSQLPAGFCLDRYGVRITITVSCLIVSIGLLLSAMPSLFCLILGRVFIAIGSAAAFLGALKTASAWLPENLFPIAVGLTNTIGVAGGLLGQPYLNHVIEQYNWQYALCGTAILGFVLTIFIAVFLRSKQQKQQPNKFKAPFLPVLKSTRIWALALYAGIMVGTVVNAFSELYDVVFLKYSHHISTETAALISGMIFLGIALGGPLHGIIAKCFKKKSRWMLIANSLTILLFSLVVLSSRAPISTYFLYPLYFLIGFFVSSMLLAFAYARDYYRPQHHALIFALINMVVGVCGFLFQELLGTTMHLLKNQTLLSSTTNEFFASFLILLGSLLISWVLCFRLTKEPNKLCP